MSLRNLDDLSTFLQVVNRKSFSAAARELYKSPKTVSQQIARLELTLGTTLFERNTRNLKITDEGRAIAERARVALAILDEIEELAANERQEISGTIRLTSPAPFGRKYVTPAISEFCRLHPRVGFDLRLSDQVVDLFSSDLDMAIRLGELADSRLLSRKLTDNKRVIVASPDYLQRYSIPSQPEDLIKHNCLLFSYPGLLQDTWPLRRGKNEQLIRIRGAFTSDNGEVLREWCMAGLGISMREVWDVCDELRDGRLVRLLTEWEVISSQISIVRSRREPIPKRLAVFIDFLVEKWRQPPWEITE